MAPPGTCSHPRLHRGTRRKASRGLAKRDGPRGNLPVAAEARPGKQFADKQYAKEDDRIGHPLCLMVRYGITRRPFLLR